MALAFSEQRKRKNYLYVVFLAAILIGAIWFGKNYLVKPSPSPPLPPKEKKVEINLEILEGSVLQKLRSFEEILPFKGEVGRDNPFLPYEQVLPSIEFSTEPSIEQ